MTLDSKIENLLNEYQANTDCFDGIFGWHHSTIATHFSSTKNETLAALKRLHKAGKIVYTAGKTLRKAAGRWHAKRSEPLNVGRLDYNVESFCAYEGTYWNIYVYDSSNRPVFTTDVNVRTAPTVQDAMGVVIRHLKSIGLTGKLSKAN